MCVIVAGIVNSDNVFSDIDSLDKPIIEKVQLIEQLEEEKYAYRIIYAIFNSRKLKHCLINILLHCKENSNS